MVRSRVYVNEEVVERLLSFVTEMVTGPWPLPAGVVRSREVPLAETAPWAVGPPAVTTPPKKWARGGVPRLPPLTVPKPGLAEEMVGLPGNTVRFGEAVAVRPPASVTVTVSGYA